MFAISVLSGVMLWVKMRKTILNPFRRPGKMEKPPPPPGKGDIIEGEYSVIHESSEGGTR